MGEIVNLNAEQLAQTMQNDGHIQSALFKELTDECFYQEFAQLQSIHFPFTLKPGQTAEPENKFTARNWYTESPCEQDTLYQIVQNVYKVVQGSLQDIDEMMTDKRQYCGESSEYLILIPDEDR